MTKLLKQDADALIAAGFWVRMVRVVAASYLTACEGVLSSSKMQRMYLEGNRLDIFAKNPKNASEDFARLDFGSVEINFSQMVARRRGNFSITSL